MPTLGTVTMPGTATNAEPDWRKAIERARLLLADEPMHFALLRMYCPLAGPMPAGEYAGTQNDNPHIPGEWRSSSAWGGIVFFVRDDYWAEYIMPRTPSAHAPTSVLYHNVLAQSLVNGLRAKLTPLAILREMGIAVDTHAGDTKVG